MTLTTYAEAAARLGTTPDDPRLVAYVDRHNLAEQQAPATVPPCPSWCELPTGHEYDSVDYTKPVTFGRFHTATVTPEGEPFGLTLEQVERCQGGVVTSDQAGIAVYSDLSELTPERVRTFAAALSRAADLLEQIAGQP